MQSNIMFFFCLVQNFTPILVIVKVAPYFFFNPFFFAYYLKYLEYSSVFYKCIHHLEYFLILNACFAPLSG